jgi:hypothetical protein
MTSTIFPLATDVNSADSLLRPAPEPTIDAVAESPLAPADSTFAPAAQAELAPTSALANARFRITETALPARDISPSLRAQSAGATSDKTLQSRSQNANRVIHCF